MKKQTILTAAVAAVFGLSIVGAANAAVTFGDGGTALQGVLDNITVAPVVRDSRVDVNTDQLVNDKHWSITGAGGSVASIIVELAGFANQNTFGVYDSTNPGVGVQLFNGVAGAGDQVFMSIKIDGSVFVNNLDSGVDFAGNSFGYWLNTPQQNTWYSDSALNLDGKDHLAAYLGTNTDTVQLPGLAAGLWTNNEYVMAWEDLSFNTGSDADYTDFVVMVESVKPIPEPGILALMGLGLLGFMDRRRFTTKV